ncbi:abortive infection protein [Streptomyces sp. NBC_01498]|uniref:abortive infection protein n=1 Tax=Streptomyces sp. NBC_01498 TaxID=2975870 RepID=UPI002E7B869B|nr:abortive infection protein [Streptomyces sp. NBC_01498]WTL23720.1 abortive infection protein [Streptomyces sp. NBC_01498]
MREESTEGATPLVWKGVDYDTGTNYSGGAAPPPPYPDDVVRSHMALIRDELHANSVTVLGTDIDRLAAYAGFAAEAGLHVWLQPRLIEGDPEATVAQLGAAAEAAERLRQRHGEVDLNVGCELTIFGSGMVPGDTFVERSAKLALPEWWPRLPEFSERLDVLLARAVEVARARFGGRLTYGGALWERVDWSGFDFVGQNYYRMAYNSEHYVDGLRAHLDHGKPLLITEFGCCTFEGAAAAGPTGYDIVDRSADPPVLNGDYVRSEREQADCLTELLDLYETHGVHGAYVYEFAAAKPYSPVPARDLDMASFGLLKSVDGGWEPKESFRAVAERYGARS